MRAYLWLCCMALCLNIACDDDDNTGGGSAGDMAGEAAGEPAGEEAGEPAGEEAGEPAGEEAGEPAGEEAGEPAGEEAGEPAGEEAGEPAGETAGETPAESVLADADIVGTWAGGCEAYPDGMGGMNYLDRQFSFNEGAWKLFGTVYGDEACSYPVFSFNIVGTYSLEGASPDFDDVENANFVFEDNVWVAYDSGFVDVLNNSGCGAGGWEVGVPQSVNETGCIGVAHPAAECPEGELDLLSLREGKLYLGDRSTDLCAGRANAVGTYGLSPVADTLLIDREAFYPEGITMRTYGSVYVSAVGLFSSAFGMADTEGSVMELSTDGASAVEVVPPHPNDETAVGMDVSGDTLWYCSLLFGQFESALVAFDLENGVELGRYDLGAGTFCNDVIADAAGNVYVADSFGKVFKYSAEDSSFGVWAGDVSLAPLPQEEGGFIGANGIVLSHDRSAVIVGTSDTANIVEIAINMDGSAGEVVERPLPAPVLGGGIDGMVAWRGAYYMVRDFGVQKIIEGEDGWTVEDVVAAGEIDSPTTLVIDNFGNMWIVASQFQYLFDEDPESFGAAPFEVVRKPLY